MSELKRNNFKLVFTCFAIVFISFIGSFIFNEDSLGGAYNDYKLYEKYFLKFAFDFKGTFLQYGNINSELWDSNNVRNSPIFYIIVSKLINFGFELKNLKYLNIIFVVVIIFYFIKSLEINFDNIKLNTKILFLSTIILSPTIRSLTIHPYPFLWAISFFVISLYFYLKFQKIDNKNKKFKYALLCILNLSIAAYLTPNFAMFILYYWIQFLKEFKFSSKLLFISLFAFLISLPALIFLVWKDFYLIYNSVYEISFFEKFNIFNKIVIISSIVFLFILPIIRGIKFTIKPLFIFQTKNISLIIISIACIYFFNFKPGAGGGLFYQLSNLVFENNILLFLIFLISIVVFDYLKFLNSNNLLIFLILILYNLQYTIYYKYFDPILIFIILFMMKFDKNKVFNVNRLGKRYFIFYVIFLLINIYKSNLKIILI